jgi:hypothetical protein
MQITPFLHQVVLSSVACLAVPQFAYCLVNGTIYGEKIMEHKMCVLIFPAILSETLFILRRI